MVLSGKKFWRVIHSISPALHHETLPALQMNIESESGLCCDPSLLLEIQRDMAVALLSVTRLDECLDLLLSAAIRLTSFDSGAIYLCDETSGDLSMIAHQGLSTEFVARVANFPRDSEFARLAHAGTMRFSLRNELIPEEAATLAAEGLETMVMVPLRENDRLIACLNVSSRCTSRLENSVQLALESLAAVGEISIAALRSRESLRREERLSSLAVKGAGLGQIERDADGEAVCMIGVNMDVTESKRLEQLLRDSEGKYRTLHESITDAFVCVDMNRNILECNQAYLDLTGYTREEIFHMSDRDLTPRKWHSLEALIVENQEWNESLERRVMERTMDLKESEDRFKQLAAATFEGIAICENGILLDANSQLASIHGYELSEMIGRSVMDFVAPESRDTVAERIRTGEDSTYESFGLRKDGSIFPQEIRARMVLHQDRKIRVSALRDLTDAKAKEARILAQQTELEEVQRLALVSEIAAGIIHQVGQPLSCMGANLVTAIQNLKACNHAPCDSIQLLHEVESDVSRMREIVTHLRSLADPARAERRPCQLNQIIESVLPILRPGALCYRISLSCEFGADLVAVSANPIQMSQVILNLVKNAFDACAELTPERRSVLIRTSAVGQKWVELSVRDSGIGILPEVHGHLFRPFFSTKSDDLGIGVGLRLCRTIMEAHDGTIAGSNNVDGNGATFFVRFPI